jgi:hypothetical protein
LVEIGLPTFVSMKNNKSIKYKMKLQDPSKSRKPNLEQILRYIFYAVFLSLIILICTNIPLIRKVMHSDEMPSVMALSLPLLAFTIWDLGNEAFAEYRKIKMKP